MKRLIYNIIFYFFIVWFVKDTIDINNDTLEYVYYGWCFLLFNIMNKSVKEYMSLLAWMILPFIVTGLLVNLTGNTIENIFNYGYSIKYFIGGTLDHQYLIRFGYIYMGLGLIVMMCKKLWNDLPNPTNNVSVYQPNKPLVNSNPPRSRKGFGHSDFTFDQ